MKIAIIYKSISGNTKLIAEAIYNALKENVIYIGEPGEGIKADLYFVGSWTDKGTCCQEVADFIRNIDSGEVAYFGTAGFGGSQEYYNSLFSRIKEICPDTVKMNEYFFCQGKMPMSVRDRYVSMLQSNPNDSSVNGLIINFDEALNHPNDEDVKNAAEWALHMKEAAALGY